MEKIDNTDILDNNSEPLQKRLWAIRLLIIGGGIIAATFLVATFWETLGLNEDQTVWLALSQTIAFGINLAGLILGFVERKRNKKRSLVGIIGNLVFILLFVSIIVYSFSS